MKKNKTIAAIATGSSVGSISVIRISGNEAFKIINKVFKANSGTTLEKLEGYTARLGKVYKANKTLIDEAIALVFKAPNSYTGENVVELFCHGGIFITRAILKAIFDAGASAAEAGEFTKRAFLNSKLSLTKAESIMDLISASGEQSLNAAIRTFRGKTYSKVLKIRDELLNLSANFSASLDYEDKSIPEIEPEEVEKVLNKAIKIFKDLVFNYEKGRVIKEGIRVAIVGKPNTGKSTLMNFLVKSDKSIVTNISGTTRDIIEETVIIKNGITLRLVDTAGIRETKNIVEKIGVKKSLKELSTSDLLLVLFDSSKTLSSDDFQIIKKIKNKKAIAILNKIDLSNKIDKLTIKKKFKNFLEVSLSNNTNNRHIDKIEEKILETVGILDLNPDEDFLANQRQLSVIKLALKKIKLASSNLKKENTLDVVFFWIEEAVSELLSLTGQKLEESVIEKIFSNFCVGK
ncbi:MAG: tRNA uridine-5-carboxymethylaminomethyl(34) synthesis GTPase MnmE [Oscillospiraceae bacterium]|nr:tRNA uridine-5-carboxymethylaminomethyl(34) synthesis GTPase MnmE [Oscillospiraceae bacterium]